jgi:hypothetical protein
MSASTKYHYTTAFGATLDIEIGAAIRAGMPMEKIAAELGHRWGELFDAIIAKRRFEESQKCAH